MFSAVWRIANDVHMDGFGVGVPDVERCSGRAGIGFYPLGEGYLVGATLLRGVGKTQEKPVVKLAREGMVSVHGLGFARYGHGVQAVEGRVIGRGEGPIVGSYRYRRV